jgi:hypothetical protein
MRLRTYPQIGQLDNDQNVEQAKADGRNHLSLFSIGPQGQKITRPETLVGWHRAGFTQKRRRKEATVGEDRLCILFERPTSRGGRQGNDARILDLP